MPATVSGTSLAELNSRQVRMVCAPLATVTELACEAVGRPMGSPSSWPAAVRDALEPCDLALLTPAYGPDGPPFVPDSLLPAPTGHSSSFEDELDRLAQHAPDALEPELFEAGLAGSQSWAPAARYPQRWVGAYLVALHRAWAVVAPLWHSATPLLEREVERVGAALARGLFSHVMDGLAPRGRVEGDRWFVCPGDPPAVIADGFVLQPMLIGPRARLVTMHNDKAVSLAYPVPGGHRLDTRRAGRPRHSLLESLLGEPRAEILRRLDRAVAAGRLAADMMFAPSAITHHLIALERAGLIDRERQGRHVMVRRTARGTALLQLYES